LAKASKDGGAPESKRLAGVAAALILALLAILGIERGIGRGIVTWNTTRLNAKLADNDELWHLETGRVIVETGRVPDRDPFTYTAGETRWTNTNWLAQIVLWELYRAGGIELDWILGIALWLGAVAFVHVRARRRAKSPIAAMPATFYVLVVLRRASEVRPQGWTFLLLAVAVLLADALGKLDEDVDRRRRTAIVLALVLALEDQLHGGFVFLHAAVFLAALGAAWDARSVRAAGPLALALLAGVLGFALHPHHLFAFVHPFRYALEPSIREISARTSELMPPVLEGVVPWLIFLPPVVVGAGLLADRRRFTTADLLQLAAFFLLALQSARGLHYFAVVAAGPLATATSVLVEGLPARWRFEVTGRVCARFAPLALALAFAVTALVRAPNLMAGKPADMSNALLADHAALAELADVIATLPQTRVLNECDTGGVLLWRMWPAKKVFVDTRGDLHALSGACGDEARIFGVQPGWDAALARWGCDVAVTELTMEGGRPVEPRIAKALRARGWTPICQSRQYVLLVAPSSK